MLVLPWRSVDMDDLEIIPSRVHPLSHMRVAANDDVLTEEPMTRCGVPRQSASKPVKVEGLRDGTGSRFAGDDGAGETV
ncbi:hypothetical protein KYC5002_39595 [Archangium violaceum]|uniref:hypothetical protein n=1 Tax=Archangium violaceum TaxID=83451 RepID=UPI002B2BE226|nr:hypothetical protein KYC5002_39595 [Archangium gephyra]